MDCWERVGSRLKLPAEEREESSGVRAGRGLEVGDCHDAVSSPGKLWWNQEWREASGGRDEA